ncbi:MAG TPA: 50S ribosomal protein L25 [Oculatellaceae cyanobacterium]|jgi:large subunit ribosomal protein L25
MSLSIECQKRPEGSKPRALRRSGLIPAVLYGHQGRESISLVVDSKAVGDLLKASSGKKPEVQLNIPELSWSGTTVLQEVQIHPWKRFPYHVSFFATKSKTAETAEAAEAV